MDFKIAIIGATGLVGNAILRHSDASKSVSQITTITRNSLRSETSPKVHSIIQETPLWNETIRQLKGTDVLVSAFGITQAAAGGPENFVKIDHGVNYEAAKAAKEGGIETFVLISAIGASSSSESLYFRTKGKLEEDVIALGIPRTIILKPGVLLGKRAKSKGWYNDYIVAKGYIGHNNFLAPYTGSPIHADEVAQAVLKLIDKPVAGTVNKPEVIILDGLEVNKAAHD